MMLCQRFAGAKRKGPGRNPCPVNDFLIIEFRESENLSLFKVFPITSHEGPRIELRFESFNTFKHTNYQGVDRASHDANFGQVTSDYGPRLLELGGKFIF